MVSNHAFSGDKFTEGSRGLTAELCHLLSSLPHCIHAF